MAHLINKLHFDMVYESEAMAKQAHSTIKDALPKEILPIITEVLDEIAIAGFVLEIDKLVIDFGDLQMNFFKQQLKEKISVQLKKSIKQKLKSAAKGHEEDLNLSPKNGQNSTLLAYFLKNGRLPWWADKNTNLDAILEEILKNPAEIKQLFLEIGQDEKAIRRLIIRFGKDLVLKMMAIAYRQKFPALGNYLGQFLKNIRQSQSLKSKQKAAQEFFLMNSLLLLQGEAKTEEAIYQQITSSFFQQFELNNTTQNTFLRKLAQASNKQIKAEFSHQYSDADALRHFLEYGSIPHWAKLEERQSVLQLWKAVADIDLADWMVDKPLVLLRIQQQIPDKMKAEFLAALPKKLQDKFEVAFRSAKDKSYFGKEETLSGEGESHSIEKEKQLNLTKDVDSSTKVDGTEKEKQLNLAKDVDSSTKVDVTEKEKQLNLTKDVDSSTKVDGTEKEKQLNLTKDVDSSTKVDGTEKEKQLNLTKGVDSSTKVDVTGGKAAIDLLFFFLQEGHIPWWAEGFEQQDPREIMRHLLEKHPRLFLGELISLRHDAVVKRRLLRQFETSNFKLIIKELQPSLAGFITIIQTGFECLADNDTLPLTVKPKLLQQAEEVLLDLLLSQYPKPLLPKTLVHQLVEGVCEKLALKKATFYNSLKLAVQGNGGTQFLPLITIIEQRLKAEFEGKTGAIVNPQKQDFDQAAEWRKTQREILAALGLESGKKGTALFSLKLGNAVYDGATFYNKLSLLTVENRTLAQTFIRKLLQQTVAKKRLADNMRDQDFYLLAATLHKEKAGQLSFLLKELSAPIQSVLPLSKRELQRFLNIETLTTLLHLESQSSAIILATVLESIVKKAGMEMPVFVEKLSMVIKERKQELHLATQSFVETLVLQYPVEKSTPKVKNKWAELKIELDFLIAEKEINQQQFYTKLKQGIKQHHNALRDYIYLALKQKNIREKWSRQLDEKTFSLILSWWNSNLNQQISSISQDLFSFFEKTLDWTINEFQISYKTLVFNKIISNQIKTVTASFMLKLLIENQIKQQQFSIETFILNLQNYLSIQKTIKTITRNFLIKFIAEIDKQNETKTAINQTEIKTQLLANLGLNSDLNIIGNFDNSKLYQQIIDLKKQYGQQSKIALRQLFQDENILNYLVEKADDKLLDLIVAQWQVELFPSIKKSIHDIFIPLKQILRHSSYTLERAYKSNLLRIILSHENQLNYTFVLEKILEKLALQRKNKLPKLVRGLQALMSNDSHKYSEQSIDFIEKLVKETKAVEVKKEKPKPIPRPIPKIKKRKKDIPKKPVEIAINNAGLVILRPYLGMYFDRLGLDLEKKEDAHRAVHLLQYIAYKTTENAEEDLVLNKILCGVPIDEPVPSGITITDDERLLSEQIIMAATQNWPAMKNTENDNFRVTFLHRNGILLDNKEDWLLTVEWRTFDFLLETITWGFKMVMMKHMDKMLKVKWQQP